MTSISAASLTPRGRGHGVGDQVGAERLDQLEAESLLAGLLPEPRVAADQGDVAADDERGGLAAEPGEVADVGRFADHDAVEAEVVQKRAAARQPVAHRRSRRATRSARAATASA